MRGVIIMGLFSKLFGDKQDVKVAVEITKSWHYAGEGDCPAPQSTAPIEIPGVLCPDAVGYSNLCTYHVQGYKVNPKTGRNNKTTLKINASSVDDAKKAVIDSGMLEPITVTAENYFDPPNEYQISDAKEYGISIPNGATNADVGAMVYRKTESNGVGPSSGFALFCTQKRLLFSRFIGERDLLTLAYTEFDVRDKVALFACAVDCSQHGIQLGNPHS
ncbi:MAG: hypothetical protein RR053_07645, partial [Evtepia sp.]